MFTWKTNRDPIFSMKQLGKLKSFTVETACLKTATFLQPDSVYELHWLTSKLQSLNRLLGKLKFSWGDPVYEMNWITSKFHISNSLLEKFKLSKIRFSLEAYLNFLKHFEARIACLPNQNFSEIDFVYETIWKVS